MLINKARNAFLSEVVEQIKQGEDIVIVAADLASPVLDALRQVMPERFVTVGIAEQNLIAVGSGIALSGSKVLCYTANPFLISRAYDQIRNSVSLMSIPLCLVGIGAGFNTPEYGATHYVTEDIALIRTCPNIDIYNVADENLGHELGRNVLKFNKPTYIRIDKENYEVDEKLDLNLGFRILNIGKHKAVVSSGFLALKIFEENKFEIQDNDYTYIDIFSYQFNRKELKRVLKDIESVVVIEENIEMGSLFEVLKKEEMCASIKGMHIDFDEFPHCCGSRDYFLGQQGLTFENLRTKIK